MEPEMIIPERSESEFGEECGRRSTHESDLGAALVEMALVVPLLLLMIVGIWATARAWNVHTTMDHAVREAARVGATLDPWTDGTTTDTCATSPATSQQVLRCVADEQLEAASIDPALVTTTCIELATDPCSVGSASGTDKVAVSITYPNYQIDFVFFSVSVDLSATAVSRYE
jgi:Flp pilus assembly protein TadG